MDTKYTRSRLAEGTPGKAKDVKRTLAVLGLGLVVGLIVLAACGPAAQTMAGEADSRPSDPVGARDAVLAYLAEHYADQAPRPGTAWTEQHTKPEGLLGGESYRYTAGDWTIDVSYPVVAPDMVVYTVAVASAGSGFHFEASVDAHGQVTETQPPQR